MSNIHLDRAVSNDILTTEETNCSSYFFRTVFVSQWIPAIKRGICWKENGSSAPVTLYRYDKSAPKERIILIGVSTFVAPRIWARKRVLAERNRPKRRKETRKKGARRTEEEHSLGYINCLGTALDGQRPTRNAKQLRFSMVNDHRQ